MEHLGKPLRLGAITLKHRVIMGPMGDRMWTEQGFPVPGVIDYYVARVRGGAALITIGASEVHSDYENGHRAALSKDETIPALRTVTDAIHAAGAPVLVQLHHGGPSARPGVSPSGVPCMTVFKSGFMQSRALTLDEVRDMREHFIAAAVRAQRAGFDGVEIAGQANYLLGQFFSPRMNLRTDEYGGTDENRMRLALEIVQGMRALCGREFVIGYAVCADELKPGGITPTEGIPFAQALESSGLTYLDVRVGTHESFVISEQATAHNRFQSRQGIWSYAASFKQALSIPVFCSVQGCYDPVRWNEAVARNEADVIQVGKPLLADPELPSKLSTAKIGEVRPCVFCMQCIDPSRASEASGARTYCAVNPEAGAEYSTAGERPPEPRRVWVIGGGPAGMEAARVAAQRGHQVTLIESATELGGKLTRIGECEGGDVYLQLRDWLKRACRNERIEVRLSCTATAAMIGDDRPDAVILAQGALAGLAPKIKGIDKPHVVATERALNGGLRSARNVVVVGGGQEGVLAACTLTASRQGSVSVTIIESERDRPLGEGLSFMERTYLTMTLLPKRGVRALMGSTLMEIRDQDVVIADRDGARQKIRAELVVLTANGSPNTGLYQELRAAGVDCHLVGDASSARNVAEAIHEGARAARLIGRETNG